MLSELNRPGLVMMTFKGRAWPRALLGVFGWKIEIDGLPAWQHEGRLVSRGVIAAYPHTSNWDGVIGVLTLWALGFPIHLWGKDSLFKIPVLAQILRSAGAVPIARTDSKGVVTQTVLAMQAQDVYWQGLAPEGTRKRLPGWRSGFYHLALAAGVPVALAYLDWSKKRIGVKHVVELSGDSDADMARIAACFEGVRGHTPALASPIRLLDAEFSRKDAVVKP